MGTSKRGKASLLFEDPPLILSAASVVGKKEGEGPLGKYFDRIEMDSMLGETDLGGGGKRAPDQDRTAGH